MADEKPILEYERPGSARKNRTIKTAASIVLAAAMLSMAIAQFWLPYADGKAPDLVSFTSMCLFAFISVSALVDCFRKPR